MRLNGFPVRASTFFVLPKKSKIGNRSHSTKLKLTMSGRPG